MLYLVKENILINATSFKFLLQYPTKVEDAIFNDWTGENAQDDCLQESLHSASCNRVNHFILGVVHANERTFLWWALLVSRSFIYNFVFENLNPISTAVELLIKLSRVFDIVVNATLFAIKLHDQMMIDRLPAVVRNQASRLLCQMHSI